MRKITTAAAVAAAGIAALGAASPAMAQNSGVTAGDTSLVNLDASSLAHWQICGQNVLAQSFGQDCDNRDHIGEGPQSGVWAGDTSLINADASSAAHWQICGQNILVSPSLDQDCINTDHIEDDGYDHDHGHDHDKGDDQGDH
ncbi:hypothetical protein LO763_11985 [Glycomyces sp. A-F 0318]|uniref:hypothetical protein n=1 Tax=Glycomyces amatae TaxID=2881355 RepID=UPI001E40124F|nr:hypothetical protein [Glycomyces amatae]MCD0444343.1 hypothetical protein [Glycomyces amatae]